MLNGDLITGESTEGVLFLRRIVLTMVYLDTFRENSTKLIDEIMVPINEAGVKFSSTHGVGLLVLYPRTFKLMLHPRTTITKRTSPI